MEEKYYEILRHYVNPNDCATVVKQLLSLHNVSQQRELLIAFYKHLDSNCGRDKFEDKQGFIDEFISNL